ncbi:hypothetical protein B0T21DRAFT_352372 [Apiosordaria backusii]|uniref:Uncharacterized protein n=1 Tax=Apiosordaria backusii TaxID=314023 RepID=A0AA40AER7_9PEZI|nr:hypothetical protein B0T21DRAFT_352372 [Apiosordaria backusii]
MVKVFKYKLIIVNFIINSYIKVLYRGIYINRLYFNLIGYIIFKLIFNLRLKIDIESVLNRRGGAIINKEYKVKVAKVIFITLKISFYRGTAIAINKVFKVIKLTKDNNNNLIISTTFFYTTI